LKVVEPGTPLIFAAVCVAISVVGLDWTVKPVEPAKGAHATL
jgi:hypothetical protein